MKETDAAVAVQFGANLRRCRLAADLTQDRLAAVAGLHRTEISLVERGKRVMRADTLARFLGALGVQPDELLRGIVWEPSDSPKTAGRFVVAGVAQPQEPRVERGR